MLTEPAVREETKSEFDWQNIHCLINNAYQSAYNVTSEDNFDVIREILNKNTGGLILIPSKDANSYYSIVYLAHRFANPLINPRISQNFAKRTTQHEFHHAVPVFDYDGLELFYGIVFLCINGNYVVKPFIIYTTSTESLDISIELHSTLNPILVSDDGYLSPGDYRDAIRLLQKLD